MRTGTWAALAVALPLLARAELHRRLTGEVEPALARALGVPVAVGSVDATLTGVVTLTDLSAGAALEVASVEAAFDPLAAVAGDLDPSEISLTRPRLRLAGDPLWQRLRDRLAAPHATGSRARSRLARLVVSGGALEMDLPSGGRVLASGVEVRPRGDGLRLVAGPVQVLWRTGGWQASARFTRAAVDIAPWRLIAVGGEVTAAGAGGPALSIRRAVVSAGIGGAPQGELRLAGEIAGERPGRLDLAVALAAPDQLRQVRLDVDHLPLAFLGPAVAPWALVEGAAAAGHLELDRDGADLAASARLALDGVLVAHPLLSSEPVVLDGSLTTRASLRRVAGRRMLAVDQLRLSRAGVEIDGHGLLEWPVGSGLMPERAELTARMPETSCARTLAAIPDGLRTRLAGFDVDGTLGGSLALAFDRSSPDDTALDVALDLDRCLVRAEPALSDPRRLAGPFDLQTPDGALVRVGDGPDHVVLARLPRHVAGAFVAAEDARFFRHHGFDGEQIERSLGIDLDSGKLLRGGSTISQQLVKNVFLGPERTLGRKLQEAVLTWRVESRVGKRVILERYLDLIELGEDVHGVGAAARAWFGLPAHKLGVRQAAFLAALTPAPRTLSRAVRAAGGIDAAMAERIDIVLRAMRVSRIIDRATWERARREPLRLAPLTTSTRR